MTDDREHGLGCFMRKDCACDLGRAAGRRYMRRHKALQRKAQAMGMSLTVPVIGPRRRIQALMAQGWNLSQLSDATGHHRRSLESILYEGRTIRTAWEFAESIKHAYDELWDVEPPPGRSRTYVRNHAAKRGWSPPMAWDDDSIDDPLARPGGGMEVGIDWQAVERIVNDEPVGRKLTKQERIAACQAMVRKGIPNRVIIKRLHMSGPDIKRYSQEVA